METASCMESVACAPARNDSRRITCLPPRAALQSIRYHESSEAKESIKNIDSDTAIITVLGPKSIYEALNAFYWNVRLLQSYLRRDTHRLNRNSRHKRRIQDFNESRSIYKMLAPAAPVDVLVAAINAETRRATTDGHVWNTAPADVMRADLLPSPQAVHPDTLARPQIEGRGQKRTQEDHVPYGTVERRPRTNTMQDLLCIEPALKRDASKAYNTFNPSGGVYGGGAAAAARVCARN
jgi:hypothetical protein